MKLAIDSKNTVVFQSPFLPPRGALKYLPNFVHVRTIKMAMGDDDDDVAVDVP